MQKLVYKEIVNEDINEICSFLNNAFETNKFTLEYIEKIYFKYNSVIGYNVFNGPKIIAHYCVLRRVYEYSKFNYVIGWSVNTAVDKEFRGRGFFLDLATRTYTLAKDRGLVAIVGVANRNSTRLFLEKLGFKDKGIVKWNLDLLVKYESRKSKPKSLSHINTKTINYRRNYNLLFLPFVKIYSDSNLSVLNLYLTNRKKIKGVGVSLPQSWFKSNWQVITLNLKPMDTGIESFLKEFAIDIAESDTF